jgi:hypothetical protein
MSESESEEDSSEIYFSGMAIVMGSSWCSVLKPIISDTGISQEGPSFTNDGISTRFRY